MTYDQYWYGDPLMVRAFLEADKIRQQRINDEAWLHGAYVYKAVASVVEAALSKKGSRQHSTYPDRPIAVDGSERKKPEMSEEQQAVFAKAYMMQMLRSGKNWGNQHGGN